MKDWRREALDAERTKVLLVFVIFLTICNYFLLSITLSMMLVSLLVIFIFSHAYHKYINISLVNNRKTIRLFPGETAEVTFEMDAKSVVSLYYGKLTFLVSNVIKAENIKSLIEKKDSTVYSIDISSGKRKYTFPILANQRGRVTFRQMEVQLFDPLFLGRSTLLYNPFYKTEILVFPKIKSVSGMESLLSKEQGNNPSIYSFFQDPILISGVRDYIATDPFQQIHWKASARTGNLQTKILEKTFHQKWTFLVNVSEEDQGQSYSTYFSNQLESRISHIAYLLQLAEKQGVAYEVYINIVARNHRKLVNLEEGNGKEHLLKGLELLARIDHLSPLVKVDRLVKTAESSIRQSTCLILCGVSKEGVLQGVSDSYIHQLPMYELYSTETGGTIQRC